MLTWDDTVWVQLHSAMCWGLSLSFIPSWRMVTRHGCGSSQQAALLILLLSCFGAQIPAVDGCKMGGTAFDVGWRSIEKS